jgi:hypothetical protein
MSQPRPQRLIVGHTKQASLKRALFAVYLSTLSLSTTPQARAGGGGSRLHGLLHGGGRPRGLPRPRAWAVGPLWAAWAGWFDALVVSLSMGARCHVAGAPHLALAGGALEWLTGAKPQRPFYPIDGLKHPHLRAPQPHIWLLLSAQRDVGETRPAPGGAVFTVGGLHMAPQAGWRVLPGPLGCPHMAAFALGATLSAYNLAQARSPAKGEH